MIWKTKNQGFPNLGGSWPHKGSLGLLVFFIFFYWPLRWEDVLADYLKLKWVLPQIWSILSSAIEFSFMTHQGVGPRRQSCPWWGWGSTAEFDRRWSSPAQPKRSNGSLFPRFTKTIRWSGCYMAFEWTGLAGFATVSRGFYRWFFSGSLTNQPLNPSQSIKDRSTSHSS